MDDLAERATTSSIPWVCIYCGQEWSSDAREDLLKNHIRNDCKKHPWAETRRKIALAMTYIEIADNRAMAADGPVGHARDNMSDDEWRRMYVLMKEAYDLG